MFPYLLYVMESLPYILITCLHQLVNIGICSARATVLAYRGGTWLSTQTTSPQFSVKNPVSAEVVVAMHDRVTYTSGKHSLRAGASKKEENNPSVSDLVT
jgi:hypothetical protein